ncbi:MAG: aminotransferase class IV [bacterium]
MRHIDKSSFLDVLESTRRPFHKNYYAMYSSHLGGITTDPVLMLVPVDDHVVHRGDGVFETFKCVNGSIYNLKAHLDRMAKAITSLAYQVPFSQEEMTGIVIETIRAGGHRDSLVRILVSRGPGGFGVNPYECPVSELYVTASRLPPPFMEAHPAGARVVISAVPIKPAFFAEIKACNYLPNVLMKKEAIDAGMDFAAGFDEKGYLAEGATENFGIVTQDRRLLFPKLEHILRGTTMLRVAELAEAMVADGSLQGVGFEAIPRQAVMDASEILIVGTTPDVTAVIEFGGKVVGNSKPGPVQQSLARLLAGDIAGNTAILTPVF